MAVSNFSGLTINNPQVGIQITKVTDSSADWGSVANSTYFYDKATAIAYYKDSSGNVLSLFSSASATGIWGIANTSGVYTYYATLTLALASATSGQTIEMFADVTESSATSITLKDGVNINGNGHTYNYTATTGNCFIDNGVAVTCTIQNLIVNRTNHSSGSVWTITSGSTNIDFLGSKTYMTSASAGDYVATLTGTIQNLWVKGIGTSVRGTFGGTLYNCYAEVTGGGYGITQLFPNATDCVGISVSGRGFYVYEDGTLTRCYGKSTSNYGMFCETSGTSLILYNCTCVSASGVGLYVRGSTVYTTTAISTSNVAIQCAFANNQIFNSSVRSASSNAINGQAGDKCYNVSCIADGSSSMAGGVITSNSVIICNWNNANGFAYTGAVVNAELTNSFLQVTNASANCIYGTSPVSIKYANNIYKGSTTPVNANVTQLITNTQDNQGNILM